MINRVGVACVLHSRFASRNVLLGKRKKVDGFGLWVLPGGTLEDHETPVQGVVREVREEVGVHAVDPEQLYFDWKPDDKGGFLMLYFTTVLGSAATANARICAEHEFSDLQWFSVDALPAEMWPEDRAAVERSARYWELP